MLLSVQLQNFAEMEHFKFALVLVAIIVIWISGSHAVEMRGSNEETLNVTDKYRPQLHFSISEYWINDPNGLVYLDGEYHLFYQFHPNGTTWGPMHWGHSVSTDLIHWNELPIALHPDELGQIFSGSAVTDASNSTGFKSGIQVPIVAIFTHAGTTQQQSIAISNDKGRTFTKFSGNPVIPNPGIVDFRDPKVIRYEDSWVLALAAGNKIMFYRSLDLISWNYLSEFGANPQQGAHTGVWECPDLLPFSFGDQTAWVLIVSINPGGPNGGSVTQYFVGDFDGVSFHSSQIEPLWMDWGLDNYAAISFFGDPQGRHLMMGWMNNWDYANQVPTEGWRGQMTLPRVMSLTLASGQLRLTSNLAAEVKSLFLDNYLSESNHQIAANGVLPLDISSIGTPLLHADVTIETKNMTNGTSLAMCFLNEAKQELCIGFDKGREQPIFLNRESAGLNDFHPTFSRRASAKREIYSTTIRFEIVMDVSAVEVFIDSGLTCMTALFYPDMPYNKLEVRHHANMALESVVILEKAVITGLGPIKKR